MRILIELGVMVLILALFFIVMELTIGKLYSNMMRGIDKKYNTPANNKNTENE